MCLPLLLVGMGARSVHAQSISVAKLTGTVLSEDGVALPDATLELSSPAMITGSRFTTTSAKGTYVFLNLPVGPYTLTASRDGFKMVTSDEFRLSAGSAMLLDVTLPVGTIEETITVSAEGAIVDTKASTIDSRINRDLLDQLPTTRDAFYDLALTVPGMFDVGSSGSWLPSPTAYGSPSNENVFLVNGPAPPPTAVLRTRTSSSSTA
jgi:hypothetical protein